MQNLSQTYNELASAYAQDRHLFDTSPMLDKMLKHMPKQGAVLDAGCGSGAPVATYFIEKGYQVTGIDISPKMLEIAKSQVPQGNFIQKDMRDIDFAPSSFAGVCAVYSFFHLPRAEHLDVLHKFYEILQDGGVLMLTLASHHYTGSEVFDGTKEFLGKTLPYSHDSIAQSLGKLSEAGFTILSDDLIETGGETFLWVVGRK